MWRREQEQSIALIDTKQLQKNSHQCCHSQSSRHKRPDDRGSKWVHWGLPACPGHQMGAHFQNW